MVGYRSKVTIKRKVLRRQLILVLVSNTSGLIFQLSQPLLAVEPSMGSAWLADYLWTVLLWLHILLFFPLETFYPW